MVNTIKEKFKMTYYLSLKDNHCIFPFTADSVQIYVF